MKYYGSVYKGCAGSYDFSKMKEYTNPYDALEAANKEWNQSPDAAIRRLLIVFKRETLNDKGSESKAYFQFTDSKSCELFAANRCAIEWTSPSEQAKWNGNGEMMS